MAKYKVDWDKVKTLKDVKRVLVFLDISFEGSVEGLEDIKDLIVEVEQKKIYYYNLNKEDFRA